MRPVAGAKSGPSAQSRASIACPLSATSAWRERQRAALRDLQLQPHEVEPGYGLGDGVLDLDAGVHLEEIEGAVGIEQELDGAGADITDRRRRPHRRGAHLLSQLRRDGGRGRLLDQFLMAALDRAIALAERDDMPLLVAEHLHLDVPRAEDGALDQQAAVAEGGGRLRARRFQRGKQRLRLAHDAHAAAAAAGAGLHHHGIADLARRGGEARRTLVVALVAGRAGHAGLAHPRLGRALVAHRADRRAPAGR